VENWWWLLHSVRHVSLHHSLLSWRVRKKWWQPVKHSAVLKEMRLAKTGEKLTSSMEKFVMTWHRSVSFPTPWESWSKHNICLWYREKSLDPKAVMFNLLLLLGGLKDSRIIIHYICKKVSGESVRLLKNVWKVDKLIVEENYLSEQIFIMDETSKFWKWIPERSLIYKWPSQWASFKAFKDRITVLLGGNILNSNLCDLSQWES
jgi:hypothetical protein